MKFKPCLFASILAPAILCAQNLPSDMIKTWRDFQTAVISNNSENVANLVKFPLKSNEFGTIKDRKQFIKKYQEIFTPTIIKCIQKGTPSAKETKNTFSFFCSSDESPDMLPLDFIFKKNGNAYKLVMIDNTNE